MDKGDIEKIKTLTVLYAEDEKGIREKVADSLSYFVKDIYKADNGIEALEIYEDKKPDIIFTDILMPVMDGIELIKKIRKTDRNTPAVFITAHTEKEYLLKSIDLHLENYIVKPINLNDLKNTLVKCLRVIEQSRTIKLELPMGVCYDMESKILSVDGKESKISKKEMLLFELLIKNIHRISTYNEIEDAVWGDEYMSEDALKSLVRNLRHKLPKNYIINLSGMGYKIDDKIS